MSESKKEIIRTIQKMSGKYSSDAIFADWVMCTAIAIQNALCMVHDSAWEDREKQYINTMKKYTKKEQEEFSKMFILLSYAYEDNISDVLGEIYMELECGSKQTGQFFTPFHVSELTAKMSIPKNISTENKLVLNEPSVGGGGMIIATAKTLQERGLNYQKCMVVTAQDLDWRSVYMTYVQLSLLGIDAEVVQGDTLSEPYVHGEYPKEHVFKTPARMGMMI